MKYKDIMGYTKKQPKKKVVKEKLSPKQNKILESVKKELNEWSHQPPSAKRWSKDFNGKQGLTEFEKQGGKDTIKEGPSYEYKKDITNIDKSYKLYAENLLNFYEKLRKKGLDKEASMLIDAYKKGLVTFKKTFDKIVRKLL